MYYNEWQLEYPYQYLSQRIRDRKRGPGGVPRQARPNQWPRYHWNSRSDRPEADPEAGEVCTVEHPHESRRYIADGCRRAPHQQKVEHDVTVTGVGSKSKGVGISLVDSSDRGG